MTHHHHNTLQSPDGKRHLWVTDLDGTLLNDTGRVSSESAEILSWLTERGVMFTVATARTPATVEPLLRNVHTSLPAIVMTGAATWMRDSQRYATRRLMPDSMAEEIFDTCLTFGIHPFVYRFKEGDDHLLHVYHSPRLSRKEMEFIDERRHLPLKRFHLVDDASVTDTPLGSSILFFTMGDRNAIFAAADVLSSHLDCSVSAYPDIYNHRVAIMEIFASGVSKGDAVRRLALETGADHVTVFGDNLNDIAMMAQADTAVAVANAQQRVIDFADTVIGPNTTDAVARYILRHYTCIGSCQ